MCERAVEKCLHPLTFITDYLKTEKKCEKAVEKDLHQLGDFPDYPKTQEMCEKAVEDEPEALEYVPDHFKAEEICKEAMRKEPNALGHVMPLTILRHKKCGQNLLQKTHGCCTLSLIVLELKRCATRPLK